MSSIEKKGSSGGTDGHDDDPLITKRQAGELVSRDTRSISRWEREGHLTRCGQDRRRGVLYRRSHVLRASRIKQRRVEHFQPTAPSTAAAEPSFTPEQIARILEHRANGTKLSDVVRLERIDPDELVEFVARFEAAEQCWERSHGAFVVSSSTRAELSRWLSGPAIVDEMSLIQAVRQTVDALEDGRPIGGPRHRNDERRPRE